MLTMTICGVSLFPFIIWDCEIVVRRFFGMYYLSRSCGIAGRITATALTFAIGMPRFGSAPFTT
jgi:hypothetical protein